MSSVTSLVSYTLKTMGVSISKNQNKSLVVDFFGDWKKFNQKFAFIINNDLKMSFFREKDFKTLEKFCIANNYKIIIITNKAEDGLVSDTFKVLSLDQLKQFNKRMNECVMNEGENLKKLVT